MRSRERSRIQQCAAERNHGSYSSLSRRWLRTFSSIDPLDDPGFQVNDYRGSLRWPEGVHKAALLQPDLILLDIALPGLNGVRTAEQIREVAPSSGILFLTQNDSSDVVQAALGTGPLGYVHKTHLHRDLMRAIEAVLAEKRFAS